MPALNFKTQFAELVESGKKKQTIRQVWKNPIKVGDTLYLYTGMRTKQCRKLREGVCKSVKDIRITSMCVKLDGIELTLLDYIAFAKRDGFTSQADFADFFIHEYGLPFEGVLIEWDQPQ